jgi:2-phosphoglycerate kinase
MDTSTIFYLGGSPCAGKSSVAELLAAQYGLTYVRLDDRLYEHITVATAELQPALASIGAASSDELWLIPPKVQVRRTIQAYVEEFALHLEDIAGTTGSLLLEGAALLPCLVAPRLVSKTQALYMVPTLDFQLSHYVQREWVQDVLRPSSDPKRAFAHWMRRDAMFARWVREEVQRYGLKTVVVDGTQSIAANAEMAARHLGLTPN